MCAIWFCVSSGSLLAILCLAEINYPSLACTVCWLTQPSTDLFLKVVLITGNNMGTCIIGKAGEQSHKTAK